MIKALLDLAEYRAGLAPAARSGAPIVKDGLRKWAWFEDIELNEEVFGELGEDCEREHPVAGGRVGSADARLLAVGWLRSRGH